MTARFLLPLFDSAYLLAMAAWVGSLLFFSFGVAPMARPALGDEAGDRLLRSLLPRLYGWGVVAGAIALPAYLGVPLSFVEFRAPIVAVHAFGIIFGILLMLYGGNSLTPALLKAESDGPAGRDRSLRLLRRGFVLNILATVLAAGLLIAFAGRPAPTSAGIVEPTPQERARRAFERERARLEGRTGRSAVPALKGQEAPPPRPR